MASSSSSSPTRNQHHRRHSSMPDTPPHTPSRPQFEYGSSDDKPQSAYSPPAPSFLPSSPLILTPPLTPPNPQYMPTPAASRPPSRPASPPSSLYVPSNTSLEPPTTPARPSRFSATLSRTASFASLNSLSSNLPLPVTKGSLPLTKRHRRLTALLISSTLLLLTLAYALVSLSPTASSMRLLPIDLSLLGHSSSETSQPASVAPFGFTKHGSSRPTTLHRPKPIASLPPLVLTPEQELAALVQHLASVLDTNSLPAEIDPSAPIDPDFLLGFDTRGPNKETVDAKVADMVAETWAANPVVVFTKSGPRSREVLNILSSYGLHPAPFEISLDNSRPDASLLRKMLARLTAGNLPTSSSLQDDISLPLLLLGGKPVHRTVSHLHANGELRSLLRQAGVRVGKASKGIKRDRRRRMMGSAEEDQA